MGGKKGKKRKKTSYLGREEGAGKRTK